jgi:iron-sulfur cluster repair protein YtfE (RIC family)
VKNWVIALLTTQLAAGCVATSNELAAVKTEFSYDQEQARLERQRLENRLAAVESRLVRLQKTNVRSTNSDNANKDGLAQKVLRLEADLRKFEKSSALAVQMGLISSVHADTNDQGIAGIRAELEKLSAELQALEQRLLASDKQLETGLVQLKEISAKLK